MQTNRSLRNVATRGDCECHAKLAMIFKNAAKPPHISPLREEGGPKGRVMVPLCENKVFHGGRHRLAFFLEKSVRWTVFSGAKRRVTNPPCDDKAFYEGRHVLFLNSFLRKFSPQTPQKQNENQPRPSILNSAFSRPKPPFAMPAGGIYSLLYSFKLWQVSIFSF